MDSQARLIS
jgi:hypothetical protein